MNAPLALGTGYALHAMYAGFKLQLLVYIFATHCKNYFFKPANFTRAFADQLYFIVVTFHPSGIHTVQVGAKEAGFITAGSGTDFDNGIFFVVRILGGQSF